MIQKNEIFPIGQITKTHGLRGELAFSCTNTTLEERDVSFVILEPEGILVPFFIEEVRLKTDTSGLIKLERIDTEEQAREYVGLTIYLPNEFLDETDEPEFDADYFIGFEIIDEEKGKIGMVSDLDQSTENVLFVVKNDEEEILIPAADEYITNIDHERKTIRMNLPEGLLEL